MMRELNIQDMAHIVYGDYERMAEYHEQEGDIRDIMTGCPPTRMPDYFNRLHSQVGKVRAMAVSAI